MTREMRNRFRNLLDSKGLIFEVVSMIEFSVRDTPLERDPDVIQLLNDLQSFIGKGTPRNLTIDGVIIKLGEYEDTL